MTTSNLPEQFTIPEVESAADNGATKPARKQGGTARSDVVLSAAAAGNADVFPAVLALHVPQGAIVADVTYGKGVFWQKVDLTKYTLLKSDLKSGVDCTNLPYEDE